MPEDRHTSFTGTLASTTCPTTITGLKSITQRSLSWGGAFDTLMPGQSRR